MYYNSISNSDEPLHFNNSGTNKSSLVLWCSTQIVCPSHMILDAQEFFAAQSAAQNIGENTPKALYALTTVFAFLALTKSNDTNAALQSY